MKILYHHRTRSRDGQAVHIESLIEALRAEGHEVFVVQPQASADAKFGDDAAGLTFVKRVIPRACYELLELAYNVIAYRRLRRAYREFRPDVLYERYNLFLVAGVWLRQRTGVPYLLEVNAPLFAERRDNDGLGLTKLARWTERIAWRNADAVLPVTAVLGGHVRAEGVDQDRITVIPNGINPREFANALGTDAAKEALGLAGRQVLGFTGFVRTWHRLDLVIDYIARSKRANLLLLVVGDGPARGELEAQATRLGISDRLRFTGIVPRDQVATYISAFDIALQPAATPYASPLKLFEYMVMSRAIVAPAQPNLLEVLRDGENAVLFDPIRPTAICEALDRLLQDPRLRAQLAGRARWTIDAREYTWRGNARKVVAAAERLRTEAIARISER